MYFALMNALFPLLHRPTFQRQWQERLYERDVWFACLCMSIFAVASRWCQDPRVLVPSGAADMSNSTNSPDDIWNSAGWKYVSVAIGMLFQLPYYQARTLFNGRLLDLRLAHFQSCKTLPTVSRCRLPFSRCRHIMYVCGPKGSVRSFRTDDCLPRILVYFFAGPPFIPMPGHLSVSG